MGAQFSGRWRSGRVSAVLIATRWCQSSRRGRRASGVPLTFHREILGLFRPRRKSVILYAFVWEQSSVCNQGEQRRRWLHSHRRCIRPKRHARRGGGGLASWETGGPMGQFTLSPRGFCFNMVKGNPSAAAACRLSCEDQPNMISFHTGPGSSALSSASVNTRPSPSR